MSHHYVCALLRGDADIDKLHVATQLVSPTGWTTAEDKAWPPERAHAYPKLRNLLESRTLTGDSPGLSPSEKNALRV